MVLLWWNGSTFKPNLAVLPSPGGRLDIYTFYSTDRRRDRCRKKSACIDISHKEEQLKSTIDAFSGVDALRLAVYIMRTAWLLLVRELRM